jgi:hypothetical protein
VTLEWLPCTISLSTSFIRFTNIAISVYNVILNTMGALFDTRLEFQIMAAVFVFASLGVIYLCLRREPAQLAKSV